MKSLILVLIGLAVGAICAIAAANALAKRSAHGHATMTILAYHLDALRKMNREADCAGDLARQHAHQIVFASREIGYAFERFAQEEPAFARRNQAFAHLVERLGPFANCGELSAWTKELGSGCQTCHRDFR